MTEGPGSVRTYARIVAIALGKGVTCLGTWSRWSLEPSRFPKLAGVTARPYPTLMSCRRLTARRRQERYKQVFVPDAITRSRLFFYCRSKRLPLGLSGGDRRGHCDGHRKGGRVVRFR